MRLSRPTNPIRVTCLSRWNPLAKRWIASALLLAPVAFALAAPASAQTVAFVRNERANLRSKPDTDSSIKAGLEQGRVARVLSRDGDWVQLRLASGTEGWVREDMLSISESRSKKRAKSLAIRAEVIRAKQRIAKAKAEREQPVAPINYEGDSDIQHQKVFEAKVNAAVAGVLRAMPTPQKQTPSITTPAEADPRFASAPVASSISMELETAKTPDVQPVAPDEGTPASVIDRSSTRAQNRVRTALASRGVPYRFGATGGGAYDCSSFIQYIYRKDGVGLPRTAAEQYRTGVHVPKDQLQTGDLVFFKNTYKHGVSHVGMYIGNGYFVHASSGAHEVTVSNLSGSYYQNHWAGARRPVK